MLFEGLMAAVAVLVYTATAAYYHIKGKVHTRMRRWKKVD